MKGIYILLILILILTIVEVSGQFYLKRFSENKVTKFLFFGISLYIMVAIILTFTYKYKQLTIVNVLWNVFAIVGLFALDVIYFRQTFTKMQLLGIILSVIGACLLLF